MLRIEFGDLLGRARGPIGLAALADETAGFRSVLRHQTSDVNLAVVRLDLRTDYEPPVVERVRQAVVAFDEAVGQKAHPEGRFVFVAELHQRPSIDRKTGRAHRAHAA